MADLGEMEGRKEMFYLTMHSTHFIYGYMVTDHSDSERGNPLPPKDSLVVTNIERGFRENGTTARSVSLRDKPSVVVAAVVVVVVGEWRTGKVILEGPKDSFVVTNIERGFRENGTTARSVSLRDKPSVVVAAVVVVVVGEWRTGKVILEGPKDSFVVTNIERGFRENGTTARSVSLRDKPSVVVVAAVVVVVGEWRTGQRIVPIHLTRLYHVGLVFHLFSLLLGHPAELDRCKNGHITTIKFLIETNEV